VRRSRIKRLVFACAFAAVACRAASAGASGEYKTVEVEGLKIAMDTEWGSRTTPGYFPLRFEITNLSEARVIEIAGNGMRFLRSPGAFGQIGINFQQTIRLARGDRVRLTIPVPVYADNETIWVEIREGGRSLEHLHYTGFSSRARPEHASALIVADGGSAFAKVATLWPRPFTMAYGGVLHGGVSPGTVIAVSPARPAPSQPLDVVLAPERLPDNWLGYTSLRAVLIGPTEWQALSEPQRNALLTWTACGGDLFLVDGDAASAIPGLQKTAAGTGSARAYFFGRVHEPTAASVATAGLADVLTKTASLQDGNWALPANKAVDWGKIAGRGFLLTIPGVEGIPARAFFFILVVFSVLIGPVNYWLLWRARRQVLVVLTTPLISAIFILVLGGYVLAGEGIGVRGRAVTFTMLDQARKQAATRASASLYAAGMAPTGGLRFARDEAVFPLGPAGEGTRDTLVIDLTESQRFAAGLINARSPTNLETISFRPARERLNFSRHNSGVSVVNGLNATIRALIYRSGDVHYLTSPLQPGQTGNLGPRLRHAADELPPGLPLGLSKRFEHLLRNPPDGSFLAVVDRSPFWNPGVGAVDERGSFHVVFGWIEGQP
jgi:hypothetical protein